MAQRNNLPGRCVNYAIQQAAHLQVAFTADAEL
jgi:hypothetical protein